VNFLGRAHIVLLIRRHPNLSIGMRLRILLLGAIVQPQFTGYDIGNNLQAIFGVRRVFLDRNNGKLW
jgi:hypothetical protein